MNVISKKDIFMSMLKTVEDPMLSFALKEKDVEEIKNCTLSHFQSQI